MEPGDIKLGLPVRILYKDINNPYYSGFVSRLPKKDITDRYTVEISFRDGQILWWYLDFVIHYKEGHEI